MKKTCILFAISLFMSGCTPNRQSGNDSDDHIIVDVTQRYPEKELILQDFMDVEYIVLETNDDFLTQGVVLSVGKEIIVVGNRIRNGDIFIFDRKGKALRKFNRMGQGPEEYTGIELMALDEENNEMFINDGGVSSRKILVYDLYGNFKRSFINREGYRYGGIYMYDRDNLIFEDIRVYLEGQKKADYFFIVSKQDGSVVKEIKISFKQEKPPRLMHIEGNNVNIISPRYYPIIPHRSHWILTSPSSDTIFRYLPDHTMTPFIVRTPSIQSMDPEVFLFPGILTDRYYFMESVKKEYDFRNRTGLPSKNLMYDRQEKTLYECTVYNDDYNERTVNMSTRTLNDEIACWEILEAYQLVEAYGEGKLKGRLKEIAAELDEEDNPVIMLVKFN